MVAGYSPLGTPKEWTSGRKGNLQIVVRLSLGILGIVLLVVPSSTWTPGLKIEKRELHTVRWGWNNATIPRTQDNFTCQANQRCTNIVNITIPGTMWAGPPDPQRNRYRPTFALHQSEGNITINAAVNISCCSKPYRFRFLPKEEKNKEYKNCSKQGATTFRLAVKDVLILVQKVMPSDSFYFTILRDPATVAESAFSYYRSLSPAFKKAPNFTAFISHPSHYYQQGVTNHHYAHNLLWFDLGYDPDALFTEDLARAVAQTVERTFKLVLLTEHFDESMILLKEELCWELDDVETFKLNMREASRPLEQREVEQLRAWNSLDWYLYSYFNRTFWEKVERFGSEKMDNEVKRLSERRQQLAELCLDSLEPVRPEDIKGDGIEPYQSGEQKILGWDVKTKLSLQDHLRCIQMVTPELQYINLLRGVLTE